LLLPFAVQFVHSFESHEQSICHAQDKTHFDKHEIDCSVFHFKINTNTIDFQSKATFLKSELIFEKVYSNKKQFKAVKLNFKSSRAPPFLLT